MATSLRSEAGGPLAPRPAPEAGAARPAGGDFERALRQFNAGDPHGAARVLAAILEADPDQPDALHLHGVIAAQRGAVDQGAALLARALARRPNDITIRNNLAGLLLTLDRAAEAAALIEPVLADHTDHVGLHYNHASAQRQLGAHQAAIEGYRAALAVDPTFIDASLNLAATLIETGDFAEAEQVALNAIARTPQAASLKLSLGCVLLAAGRTAEALGPLDQAASAGLIEARHRLGRAFLTLCRTAEARQALERAALDKPSSADIRNDLGVALLVLGADSEAVKRFRESVARAPNHAEAHANLAEALRRTGALDEAIRHGERASQLEPLLPLAWLNLGAALLDAARPDEAKAALARALALDPHRAEAESAYGSALEAMGDGAAALAAYDRALALDPALDEARFNRALARLKQGDYRNGLADYEARRRLKGVTPVATRAPEWRGEPLAGKTLLLYSEQGFGDTLQFARFAALAAAHGGPVVLACQRPLARLLKGMMGVAAVVPADAPLPAHDLAAPLLSVPHVLGLELARIPNAVPYVAPPEPMALEATGRALTLGIVWAGSAANRINQRRSCPLAALAPLAALDDLRLHSLQVGPEAAQLKDAVFGARVIDLGPRLADFHDTAAAIMALDLVLTIDSAVAHLAGALGRPVWVMLSKGGDWRYGEAGEDCPWYPSMRLFRQTSAGDWAGVVDQVRAALGERLRPSPLEGGGADPRT